MWPYLSMAVLYLILAGLAALASALNRFDLLPFFSGLRWLSVHLITLGVLTQLIFGLLPDLVARRSEGFQPRTRWDIWLALNLGALILLVGIPVMNTVLIITGGMLIFVAALLVMSSLRGSALAPNSLKKPNEKGPRFYLAGLAFLLLGIILGSGMWSGWGNALGIANTIEVHIHTNTWGFMSLVFAGLLVDLYPRWTGRDLAWPGSIVAIFWLMVFGALGSVLGPWLSINWITALGVLLHQAATFWLLANLVKPLSGLTIVHKPGIWHLVTAYAWQFAVVLAAPLIVILGPNVSTAGIEQTAPHVLIYGWMLPFAYAVLPYLLRQAGAPHQTAELGGSWFSLVTVHAGGIFLGASILIPDLSAPLLGIAYLLWFFSLLPIVRQSWLSLISHLS